MRLALSGLRLLACCSRGCCGLQFLVPAGIGGGVCGGGRDFVAPFLEDLGKVGELDFVIICSRLMV